MKKVNFFLLFGAFVLLQSTLLHAQEEPNQTQPRVGIGVSIGKDFSILEDGEFFFLPIGVSNIHIPIHVSPKLLVEPEIGLFRSSASSDDFESSSTNLRLGLGIFSVTQKGEMNLYRGIRFGIIRSSSSSKFNGESNDRSKTDFYIGPAIGGEYFFSDYFSLGGEAQLNYVSIGQFDNDSNDSDVSESVIANRTSIFLRLYF